MVIFKKIDDIKNYIDNLAITRSKPGFIPTMGALHAGHFHGVGQVVGRLLEIMQPQVLYLGQKDYQQCMVIRKLVGMMGMSEIKLEICPTIREADGLAMSSRNRRLTESQRAVAGSI